MAVTTAPSATSCRSASASRPGTPFPGRFRRPDLSRTALLVYTLGGFLLALWVLPAGVQSMTTVAAECLGVGELGGEPELLE